MGSEMCIRDRYYKALIAPHALKSVRDCEHGKRWQRLAVHPTGALRSIEVQLTHVVPLRSRQSKGSSGSSDVLVQTVNVLAVVLANVLRSSIQ